MSEKLSPKQHRAIYALAAGMGYESAATLAGVTARTLRRWRADPRFVTALQQADQDKLAEVARELNAASAAAVDTLRTVMENPRSPVGVRIRAASEILKHRAAFFELMTLADRVSELERQIA